MTALCGSRQWQALALRSRVHEQWIAHDRQRMRAAAAASPWRRCYSSAAAALSCGRCAAELRPAKQSLRQLSLEPCASGTSVQVKRGAMWHAMHAACVQCAARQAVCARRVGTNRGMGPRRRRSDCMIARERAAKVCGRGSLARGWIDRCSCPFLGQMVSTCPTSRGRRPKHVSTTVTICPIDRYEFWLVTAFDRY